MVPADSAGVLRSTIKAGAAPAVIQVMFEGAVNRFRALAVIHPAPATKLFRAEPNSERGCHAPSIASRVRDARLFSGGAPAAAPSSNSTTLRASAFSGAVPSLAAAYWYRTSVKPPSS